MNKKIQIFHFIPGFKFGGIESRTLELYSHIDKEKYQFNIVTFAKTDSLHLPQITDNGGKIISVSPISIRTLYRHYKDIKNVFKNNQIDVAHCYSPQSGLAFLQIAKKFGVKCRILHARTSSFEGGKNTLVKSVVKKLEVKKANVRLAVSKKAGNWLFGKKDFEVIPNAIELEKYIYSEKDRESIRKRFDLTNQFVVGHVGRSTYAKNHEFLFKVFSLFNKQYQNSVLMLVGPEKDDIAINNLCERYGVKDKVILCGYQNNTVPFYSAMDVLVFPSLYEGLPGTLIEAQASGLKCIASDSITDEVKLTDDIEFLSLADRIDVWTEAIKKCIGYCRKDNGKIIEGKGYSLEVASKRIMEIYDIAREK